MSERILKALIQLFAIVSESDSSNKNRKIVELFLSQQLNQELVEEYLKLYDDFVNVHTKSLNNTQDGKRKRTSLSSVKILKICTNINSELTQIQKIIVLLRIFEYLFSEKQITEQEREFAITVAETFNISQEEYKNCFEFITCSPSNIPDSPSLLIVTQNPPQNTKNKIMIDGELDASLIVLKIESVNLYFFRYFGSSELYLNGQPVSPNRGYILTRGASIRSTKIKTIYYSDIQKCFLTEQGKTKIVFKADHIQYTFKNGNIGMHELNLTEESGKLIAVMGGSGAGKSTLLNILNGNLLPTSGKVTINNIDIHRENEKIDGLIGYVSQDDLLIEELTVYQNLYYNAKLCFKDHTEAELHQQVIDLLHSLGLEETKDLKVGNPLDKIISGGQRKRVNIGLELLREPAVLFADEPTSGLSSRDSENIMDLLKELTLKGKLVFVVIHQPSSDIFKMFDQLLILDLGGYPVYYGNPVDAVIYFKTIVNHVNANESECKRCGNVNPEQIFNTLEAKILDEYGNVTDQRRISPKQWNEFYENGIETQYGSYKNLESNEVPTSNFQVPTKWSQFKIFLTRDLLSKLTNKQYLMINLIETPLLGFILSFFIRYYDSDIENQVGYSFMDNESIPVYLFISVVVALFIGMTVSAEEIIRDQKIRKRESFLSLSNGSYLGSKIVLMFSVSAIQMFLFILVGNSILGIRDMGFWYWFALFSTACFANMVGLNISSTFNSVVTIYILIPFLLIPQLLFSGIIVRFEKLNPITTSQTHVPLIGDIMASRWAYEALAVHQYKNNKYERLFYKNKKFMSISNYKKNFWIPKINAKIGMIESALKKKEDLKLFKNELSLIQNEVLKELELNRKFNFKKPDELTPEKINDNTIRELKSAMYELNKFYIKTYNKEADKKDKIIENFYKSSPDGRERFNLLKRNYENVALSDFVSNKKDLKYILEADNQLIQRTDPIYLDPTGFRAHFYAPRKKVFGNYMETYWANMMILWLMSTILAFTLYFDLFKRVMTQMERLFSIKVGFKNKFPTFSF